MYASVNILIIFTPNSPALSSHCQGDLMIRASLMLTHTLKCYYIAVCIKDITEHFTVSYY